MVAGYLYNYIQPCQKAMQAAASKLKLPNADDQKMLETQALLMLGHIAELNAAITKMDATEQGKEVKEVQETLGEFLRLSATNPAYQVFPFIAPRVLSDNELFGRFPFFLLLPFSFLFTRHHLIYKGPLGCEFWGKKRVPGSNACFDPNAEKGSTVFARKSLAMSCA